MRNWLLAATAAAPLAFAAAGAQATTTISNGRTTPVATSTANSGAPDDVDISSGGSVSVPGTSPAVALDSSNSVTLEGSISSNNVNGATGILLNGGNTGSLTTTGAISVSESYAATDTLNKDGVVEAPFAQGNGRYGVRLIGSAPLTGSIALGGAITVKGIQSYGVSLEAPLTGALTVSAGVSLTGDAGVAIQSSAPIGGNVSVSAAVTATGQGSQAVHFGGDIGGSATFTSTVTSTGYSQTTRSTSDTEQTNLQKTPTDIEQGGSALTIAGSVASGVLFTAAPASTVSGSTADLNNDGVADGSETTSAITTYGSAPALVIGGANRAITIGAFGTGANAYGLLMFGSVTGLGVYDGVAANALTIGGGGGTVSVIGGARVTGTINATSYEANATAVHLLAGANLPSLVLSGAISSIIDHSTLVTTPTSAISTAILIDAGATLSAITNTGSITATGTGDGLSTAAIVDRGGGLSTIVNQGLITSAVTPAAVGDALTGTNVALDLRANTSGVTLTQSINPTPNVTYGSKSGDASTTTTTVTAVTPEIIGDVFLGNGPNAINLLAGGITGALSIGTGATTFLIDNGPAYAGPLTYAGTQLSLTVGQAGVATLSDTSTSLLKLSSLNIGAGGNLVLTVDPLNKAATELQVSGAATIAAGGKIGVSLISPVIGAQTYTLITSPNLTTNGAENALLSATSYLYTASFSKDAAGDALILNLTQRSTTDLGLDRSEAAALNAVLTGVQANPNVERSLLAPSDKASFLKIYDQLLPNHSGGIFLAGEQASQAISRNTTDHIDMTDAGAAQAWAKEFALGGIEDKQTGDATHIGGFGFVGGFATAEGPLGALGVTAAFVNASSSDPGISDLTSSSFTELDGGLYWTGEIGDLRLSARGSGGYLSGVTRRSFIAPATADQAAVSLSTKGGWTGWTASGQVFASYEIGFGRWFVRPQAHLDYFTLSQDGFTDKGGGNGLDLVVNSRSGSQTSGTASVVFGARFGSGVVWRPNLELGVREVFTGSAGDTTAAFVGGGTPFTLTANPITGAGGVARVGIKATGELYEISLDAQAEVFSHYEEGDAGVTIRFHF